MATEIELKKESIKYADLVWRTLDDWYQKFAEFTPNLVIGLLLFFFFLITSKFLSRIAVKISRKFFPQKRETIHSLVGFFRFLILLLGTFISLEIMGLSGFLWKFIGSLGVAGVIAGVALKDLVSSMFSGMLIGIDKVFKVGDYVTIGTNSGTVSEIGFLTTKIITDDGKKVYVPNQLIFNAPFFNITASPQRKVILNFEIPANEDITKAQTGIMEVITTLKNVDKRDAAEVVFTDLKQGIFNLQAKFLMNVGANITLLKSESYLKIKQRLDADNIKLITPKNINITNDETEKKEMKILKE